MVYFRQDENTLVSEKAIAQIIGLTIAETPGVVGIVTRDIAGNIRKFIKKSNFYYGVKIKEEDGELCICCNLIFIYGTPISTIANLVIQNINNVMNKYFEMKVKKIVVHVDKLYIPKDMTTQIQ